MITRTAAAAHASASTKRPARPRGCRLSSTALTRVARSARFAIASSGVFAAIDNRRASVTIHQTNFPTVAAARAAGKNPGNQQSTEQQSTQQSTPNNASTATQAVSHGMSAGTKAVLIIGAVGVAGAGAAYGAGLFKTGSSSSGSCSSLSNIESQYSTLIATVNSCDANSASLKTASCQSSYNQEANILQELCSCVGSPVPAAILTDWQDFQSLASSFGLATPANGSCH